MAWCSRDLCRVAREREPTSEELQKLAEYVLDKGYLDLYTLTKIGVKSVGIYFPKEKLYLAVEEHSNGLSAFVLDIPHEEGSALVMAEVFNDGDSIVDAVGIRKGESIEVEPIQVETIHTDMYLKHLNYIIQKYVENYSNVA